MFQPEGRIEELRPTNLDPARTLGEHLVAMLAFGVLVAMDVLMRGFGFRRFHGLVQRIPRIGKVDRDPERIELLCTAVDRAATYYFRRAWCLQRSAATTCLLRLRGVAAEMVIGVKKIPFYAHAWVEVEGRVVNDHPMIQEKYVVLERC